MKKILLYILLFAFAPVFAQYKTDVLVLGGSASGTAAAIQAARSGVKSILVERNSFLIGEIAPAMDIPAFDIGIWKEWTDSCKKDVDSLQTDPRLTLEKIVNKVKGLKYFKSTEVINIKEKNNGWEVTINKNGKTEKIKTKVLIDGEFDLSQSYIANSKLITFKDGKMTGQISYSPEHIEKAYTLPYRLYRTSGAMGYGNDTTQTYFMPMGAFISKEKDNLLIATSHADLTGFDSDEFKNIALWTNIGQMAGAVAAYGPFFDTSPAKANVRLTQGEVINFKGGLFPVKDVSMKNLLVWYSVQKIIATEILKFDFETGMFHPEEKVKGNDIKEILSDLYPRSRIWFIENKPEELSVKQAISLLSFIDGREKFDLDRELQTSWKEKFGFTTPYDENHLVSKAEMAVMLDNYLKPFSIRVNMAGYFVK